VHPLKNNLLSHTSKIRVKCGESECPACSTDIEGIGQVYIDKNTPHPFTQVFNGKCVWLQNAFCPQYLSVTKQAKIIWTLSRFVSKPLFQRSRFDVRNIDDFTSI